MKRVYYHANCRDGFGAAWVAWKRFGNIEFYPIAYNDVPVAPNAGDEVYVLDFSFPRETLLRWSTMCKVVVIDHHKTAEEDLKGLNSIPSIELVFDMEKSGARLTWEYFYPTEEIPEFLLYIEDRDLWKWTLPHSREINLAIRSYPMKFSIWYEELFIQIDNIVEELLGTGVAIKRHVDQTVKVMCENARTIRLGQYRVPICNATTYASEVCARLKSIYENAPFVATYSDEHAHRRWELRSNDVDVSEIAKLYEGGGHKKAAGFRSEIDWMGEQYVK